MQSNYKGHTVAQIMAARKIQPPVGAGVYTTTVPISATESKQNFGFAKFRNFYQGLIVRRMELPNDTKQSQAYRQIEWDRNAAMPWNNRYSNSPTDKERLNNPSQKAAVSQKQLWPPNTYQQWYAFMQAMSAAFGSLRSNG